MFVRIHFDNNGLHIDDLDENSSDSSDSDSSSDGENNRPGNLPREPPRPPDAPRPPPRAPPNQPGGPPPIDPDPRIPPDPPGPPGPPDPRDPLADRDAYIHRRRVKAVREQIREEGLEEIMGDDEELINQMADEIASHDSFHTVIYSSSTDDDDDEPKPPRNAVPVVRARAVRTMDKQPLYEPQPITINNNAAPINVEAPIINVQPPVVNVEGARLNVEAPRVNVEAPQIHVDIPPAQIQVNVPPPQIQVNVPPPQIIHQETHMETILMAIREELNSVLYMPYMNSRDNLLMEEEENRRGPPPAPGAAAVMERPAVLHEPDTVQQVGDDTQPPAPPAPAVEPSPTIEPAPMEQEAPVMDMGDIQAVLTAMEMEIEEDKANGWHNWSEDNGEPSSVEPSYSMDVNPVFNSDITPHITSLDPDLDSRGNFTDASVENSGKKRRVEWKKYTKNARILHRMLEPTLRGRKKTGNTTSSGKYITKKGHDYLQAKVKGYWMRLRSMPTYTGDQLNRDGLPTDWNARQFLVEVLYLVEQLPANSTSRLKERLQRELERILPHLRE